MDPEDASDGGRGANHPAGAAAATAALLASQATAEPIRLTGGLQTSRPTSYVWRAALGERARQQTATKMVGWACCRAVPATLSAESLDEPPLRGHAAAKAAAKRSAAAEAAPAAVASEDDILALLPDDTDAAPGGQLDVAKVHGQACGLRA